LECDLGFELMLAKRLTHTNFMLKILFLM